MLVKISPEVSMDKEDELINYWSEHLSERLLEIRMVDVETMKAAMVVHLKSALYDCLRLQLFDTEKELIETKLEYIQYGGGKSNHIQKKLVELNRKAKEQNRLFEKNRVDAKGKEMAMWMRKHHENILLEFYKYFDSIEKYNKIAGG